MDFQNSLKSQMKEENDTKINKSKCKRDKSVYIYKAKPRNWYKKPDYIYAFRHPNITDRLERFMGTNLAYLNDRQYFTTLQERVFEDYKLCMKKRIAQREVQEKMRYETLILSGKLRLGDAPKEMKKHPLFSIEEYCNKKLADKRSKIKEPKVIIPKVLFVDDTPDPLNGLSIAYGHIFRKAEEKLCFPPSEFLKYTDVQDTARGFMLSEEDMEYTIKFTPEQIEDLEKADDVAEMFDIADDIIGTLTLVTPASIVDDYKFF